jgi:outer membrane protein assembly factor BamB
VAAFLAAASALVAAESWPMLGGTPSRNMANPAAKNVPTDWSVDPDAARNVLWHAELGSAAYGGPVVAGGRVFVGTNNSKPRNPKVEGDKGVLMCFEEATGKFLWQAVHDKLDNPSENDYPEQGIASTPCVDGEFVYYVSNRCELVCATTRGKPDGTADIKWSLDMIKDLKVYPCQLAACSPLVVGKYVYVVTGNGITQGGARQVVNPDAPSFVAVEKDTGKVKWTSNLPGKNVIDGQWSNPVYAEVDGKGQVIFPGGDGWLYSFEPDVGKLLWKFDCNPKGPLPGERAATKNNIIATPVVADGKLYVGSGCNPEDGVGVGHLWCIDVAKGKDGADVSPKEDNFDSGAAVNKDSALVWHYGGMNPVAGAKPKYLFSRTLSTCAVAGGLCYVADYNGFQYCFDAKTGEKKWAFDLKATVWAAPTVLDGKVFIGTERGELWVFKAGAEAPGKELAKLDMMSSLRAPPVFVNGVLYVQTDGHLYAIKAK